jgi:V8-like Glu-specific endopeptidase
VTAPLPPSEWGGADDRRAARSDVRHEFPPRPEVVEISESDLDARAVGATEHDGQSPPDLPVRPLPGLLRPEEVRRPPWRRTTDREDDRGEPVTVFQPDTRAVIYDTAYPWSTCGRVAVPGGWGSGVMIGRRHVMTANHVVPWLAGGGADWMTFTPMQYDTSAPFTSAHVTRIYSWRRVNGADGIDSNEGAFDFVVCVLSSDLGADRTGWLGSRQYQPSWNGLERWAHIGYPFDVGSGSRPVYTNSGVMDSTVAETTGGREALRIMHRNDIRPGQSGGPYFGWWAGETAPRVVATQSAENWGFSGGPNAASGGRSLPELIAHATTVEP